MVKHPGVRPYAAKVEFMVPFVTVAVPAAVMSVIIAVIIIMISVVVVPVVWLPRIPIRRIITPVP